MEKFLRKCGYSKTEAAVLSYLLKNKSATSRDIEHTCCIAQPYASTVLTSFIEQNLLTVTKIPRTSGKGRPENKYTLSNIDNVLNELNEMIQAQINDLQSAQNNLQTLLRD